MQVICALPSAISSLCLNPSGLASVIECNALGALLSIFTLPKFKKVIKSGDTAARLGAGVDELLRHHPTLKIPGIKAIVDSLRRLCKMGGLSIPESEQNSDMKEMGEDSPAEIQMTMEQIITVDSTSGGVEPTRPSDSDGGADAASPSGDNILSLPPPPPSEEMELSAESSITQDSTTQPPPETSLTSEKRITPYVEPEIDSKIDSWELNEYIGNLGRFLETVFNNSDHGRQFIEVQGLELMFALQSLPELRPTFPGSTAAHSLTQAFRSLTAHHALTLFRGVRASLVEKFKSLDELLPSWHDGLALVDEAGT